MSNNAVDSANGKAVSKPSRRKFLIGAAYALPAVPVVALPALASPDDDETRLNDVIACAQSSGVCMSLLHTATRTLDRDARRSVLASIATYAQHYDIEVLRRDYDDHEKLRRAFDSVGEIMERITAKHGEADTWAVTVARYDVDATGYHANYMLSVDGTHILPDGRVSIQNDIVERQVARAGVFHRDPGFPMERKA